MRLILLVALLFSLNVQAQTVLRFDKRNAQCEDKWVAYQKNEKDTSYVFGFIYIDSEAGLTLNYEGSFKIDSTGRFIPSRHNGSSLKARLEPYKGVLAVIPEGKLSELGVKAIPDWLAGYKQDENTIERLHRWGYWYNAWDMSTKALTYLEKAYVLNPKFPGVAFELGYAYNASGQFTRAAEVLTSAIAVAPKECYLYKELSYSYVNLDKIDEASKTAYKGIEVCNEKPIKAEIAFNIAGKYFKMKDLPNFNIWAKEVGKWAVKDDQFSKYLEDMASKIK
jgi:tetratricopeptide (TPR) repeat protein